MDLEVEMMTLVTYHDEVEPLGTQPGKNYLKDYTKLPKKATKVFAESSAKKELYFQKGLKKDDEAASASFHFDVLDKLVNIPTRITLSELLRLSKAIRDALTETLSNSEVLLAQVAELFADVKIYILTVIKWQGRSHILHSHPRICKWKT